MNILLIILAIFGILALFLILYYIYLRWYNYKSPSTPFPPNSYMQTVGAQCPDFWVRNDSPLGPNYNQCKKMEGINFHESKNKSKLCQNIQCTDTGSNDMKTFRAIPDWSSVTGRDSIKDRCQWRECCQLTPNVPYPWTGVSNVCGY